MYLDLARELKKLWNMKVAVIPIVIGAFRTVTKVVVQVLKNNRTRKDHPNYCVIEISQNTEKSPGDLRRLVFTQTPVKDPQLTLVWKTRKGVYDKSKMNNT